MGIWKDIDRPLFLASNSPRRGEILSALGMQFEVAAPQIDDESGYFKDDSPQSAVSKLAVAKAQSLGRHKPQALVLGGDTVVCKGSQVMGKPASRDDAFEMLSNLSGAEHDVFTGVALACADCEFCESATARTRVFFRYLSAGEIGAYLDTNEYVDKAGAYAIQGKAMSFIDKIDGCFYNVVGLPVSETIKLFSAYRHRKESVHV